MAGAAFAVPRKSCFLAFCVELMTKLAVDARAYNLSDFSLHAKMKLVREIEKNRAGLIVVRKVAEIRKLTCRNILVTDGTKLCFRRLRIKPLLMTSVARFVTGSRERHRAFARWFVTIDALGPGLKMLTMIESQSLLRRSFGR